MAAPTLHFGTDYREASHLRDGSDVTLRLVRPGDKELLRDGFERTSSHTRYLRFFTSKQRLSDLELRYLTEIDQHDHFALGAVRLLDDGSEVGLGVARFVRLADEPDVADPAIAVIDDMQGNGLGRLLFLRLVAAARERGVKQFRCEVLAENMAMRQLLHDLAPSALEDRDHEVVVVTMDLPEVDAADPPDTERARGAIYRLLALAAQGLVIVRRVLGLQSDDEADEPEEAVTGS